MEPACGTYFVSSVTNGKTEETRKESNPLSSREAIRFPFFGSFLRILPKKRLTKGRHARIFCNAPRKKREKHSWAFSSAGRAPPWHGGGHRFDPDKVHQFIHKSTPTGVLFSRLPASSIVSNGGMRFSDGLKKEKPKTFSAFSPLIQESPHF